MMMSRRGVRMNLASEPVRNKRLFTLAFALLAAGILLAAAAGGGLFARVHGRIGEARAELARLGRLDTEAKADIHKYDQDNAKYVQTAKPDIDRINAVIERKAFSWVNLLTLLEDALPGPSYILSFSPLSTEKAFIEIRLKVASTDVNELVRFIKELEKLSFGQIRVMSQARGDGGALVSDIVVGYERRK
jgi:hypothetical protein